MIDTADAVHRIENGRITETTEAPVTESSYKERRSNATSLIQEHLSSIDGTHVSVEASVEVDDAVSLLQRERSLIVP